jgi:putative nucleotide binding protein
VIILESSTHTSSPKKYEEYAYVLDFRQRGKSSTIRGREGIIITAIGADMLSLLEILGMPNSEFEIGERIYIGKEGRKKVLSVLGKMHYDRISNNAKNELPNIIETLVTENEQHFINYLNNAQPLTPRTHSLELIPGIGKIYMNTMIEEREKKKFQSYAEIEERVGLTDLIKHISQRILEEIEGETRMNIFVK